MNNNEISPVTMRQLRRVLRRWAILLAALAVFSLWATCRMSQAAGRASQHASSLAPDQPAAEPTVEYWTCSMHPEIQLPEPGDCTICGMQLVPKYAGSDEPGVKPPTLSPASPMHAQPTPKAEASAWYRCTMPECGDQGSDDPNSRCPVCGMKRERVELGGEDAGDFEIKLSERAVRLAEVETAPVESRLLYKRIRTVGRVGYDEMRYKMASAWISGRIDKLFADFTGMFVSEGDHLVEIYSPALLSAQEEYLQALRAAAATPDAASAVSKRSSDQLLRSARRKLELLGIDDKQIAAIEQSGEARTRLTVHAPIGGTIVEKRVMEGMYVKTGDPLYTIADLTHLWLLVDLYEDDLPWVKPFQRVSVTTRSLPGELFTGEIVFIDPRVEPKTRTVAVRIHVDNPAMRLKPDMWVTARIEAGLSRGGRGAVPTPRDSYACPMHPWETGAKSARCGICQMSMVPVERLPQYAEPTEMTPLLSVPRNAVMQTGERALVYVETSPAVYCGVEVVVGPLAHAEDGLEYYPILSGLKGGENVVTRGGFAIDSQMQLAGKPSLFTARGLGDAPTESEEAQVEEGDAQTLCPVMGNPINPDVFIEYKGVKVYFCCWGCDDKFVAEPDKYIPKLPKAVQTRIRAAATGGMTLCPVMGNPVDPAVFTDYRGVRIYFCCPPCIKKFLDAPDKYIPKLPEAMRDELAEAKTKEANHD